MYTAFLFFALLFMIVFLLVSSSLRLLLIDKVDKKIQRAEKHLDTVNSQLRKRNIPLPIALIIIGIAAGLMIAFALSEGAGKADKHNAPATRNYTDGSP